MWEIADYGEDCCERERGVNECRLRLWPAKGFALQQTRVAEDSVRGGEG